VVGVPPARITYTPHYLTPLTNLLALDLPPLYLLLYWLEVAYPHPYTSLG
jgi:hypothetical protein